MTTESVEISRTTMLQPIDEREQLLLKLRGQTAHIPDLRPIFADWKGVNHRYISPWVEPLRKKVEEILYSLKITDAQRKQMEELDLGLFAALWWPEASLERLSILACFVLWLFIWDDEIDQPTGAYSDNFGAAQTFRDQTLQFVEDCMGLGAVSSHENYQGCPQNCYDQTFKMVGLALRASYNGSQKRRFYNEVARYMKASATEQQAQLHGKVPTIEEYWGFRPGANAVSAVTAIGEYSMGACLPQEVMDSDPMRAIWDETNTIVSVANDLLSLKKEMRLGCIGSIVPLTFTSTNNLDEAISLSVGVLAASKKRFDEAAKELLAGIPKTEELYQQVQEFIQVQRSNGVGNLIWSLETNRYGLSRVENKDGSHEFTL
ncbi:hypothetical protein NUW58_g2797 [Xylaria curta]|uniref:Uncharacterized protein n=1 Tax=Xylaria curta TaxID=42375 RepID=A0ACC1PG96_9PEZI|nr:hypothetical protein NUW58_g2797 [Xylaria curta]